MKPIRNITVLGLGTMGHGIVQAFASAGFQVAGFDEQKGVRDSVLKRIQRNLADSLMTVTALNHHIGYEKCAKIALTAHREDLNLREAALKLGFVTGEEFDAWVRPEEMTHPSKK